MALIDVPLSTQNLAQTQPLIRANFATIDAAFSINHVPYGTANQGKHNLITFPRQLPEPAAPTGNDINMYSFLNPDTTVSELYIRRPAGASVPFTASLQNPVLDHGYSYLPSGLLLKWGGSPFLAASPVQVLIDPAPIVFNNIFNIQLTIVANNPAQIKDSAMNLVYDTNAQFFIYYTGGNFANSFVNYLIIGN